MQNKVFSISLLIELLASFAYVHIAMSTISTESDKAGTLLTLTGIFEHELVKVCPLYELALCFWLETRHCR
jgi:hypothetical protein